MWKARRAGRGDMLQARRRKETAMERSHEAGVTPQARSTDELREEMFRILDEIASARAERTADLSKKFKALWAEARGGEDPTLH
jgi:K+/H+ antiporter YhaU regulatory subunit KhtT